MDVRQLNYFLSIVDHGRFSRAAGALYLAQPSLSQAIRALQKDLGSQLFHRVWRRVVLTEAGRALIGPARQVVRSLAMARSSVEAVERLHTGRFEIAAMPSPAVGPLSSMIRDFAERHPERRANAHAYQLSGGMAQRVMIATALSADPTLLIADEPTTALDVTVEAQILDLIKRKRDELGLSILLITHDLGIVTSMADRVAVMYAGRIVGLVTTWREGRHIFYRARGGHLRRLLIEALFHTDHELTGEPHHD